MKGAYGMDDSQTPEEGRDGTSDHTPDSEQRRERSTIEFPYMDLETAVTVAKGVHAYGGTSPCEHDQLASELGISANSSGYRTRLAAARTFDLVTSERGASSVRLTELGARICDPKQERGARAEAFLRVPLYQRVYETYRGHQLPPAAALQREIERMGVAAKQAERARQVMERSAEAAGFFEGGRDRLIRPRGTHQDQEDRPNDEQRGNGGGGSGEGGDGGLPPVDPIIKGLLQRLPKAGEVWPEDERDLWLDLLKGSFKLIYKDKPKAGPESGSHGHDPFK